MSVAITLTRPGDNDCRCALGIIIYDIELGGCNGMTVVWIDRVDREERG